MEHTLGGVGGLVIAFAKPFQVLILKPWHPFLVLLVVHFMHPLSISLLLSLFGGQVVVDMLLLFFGVLARRVGGFVDCVHLEVVLGRSRYMIVFSVVEGFVEE